MKPKVTRKLLKLTAMFRNKDILTENLVNGSWLEILKGDEGISRLPGLYSRTSKAGTSREKLKSSNYRGPDLSTEVFH